MSNNRPPIPVRAGFLCLVLPDFNPAMSMWVLASEIEQVVERSVGAGTTIALKDGGMFYVDATAEEVLEACERARTGGAPGELQMLKAETRELRADLTKECADHAETNARLTSVSAQLREAAKALTDLREMIAEELNQELPGESGSPP